MPAGVYPEHSRRTGMTKLRFVFHSAGVSGFRYLRTSNPKATCLAGVEFPAIAQHCLHRWLADRQRSDLALPGL
jgi:hypothetical protein